MSAISLFGLDGITYLNEVSDRNLVWYHRIELDRINKGWYTIIEFKDRRKLIECGILSYSRICRGYNWYLTDKGKRLLNSIQQEHKH
jgi:hypothetical protein